MPSLSRAAKLASTFRPPPCPAATPGDQSFWWQGHLGQALCWLRCLTMPPGELLQRGHSAQLEACKSIFAGRPISWLALQAPTWSSRLLFFCGAKPVEALRFWRSLEVTLRASAQELVPQLLQPSWRGGAAHAPAELRCPASSSLWQEPEGCHNATLLHSPQIMGILQRSDCAQKMT